MNFYEICYAIDYCGLRNSKQLELAIIQDSNHQAKGVAVFERLKIDEKFRVDG